jgi:serine/threonine-protein kinase
VRRRLGRAGATIELVPPVVAAVSRAAGAKDGATSNGVGARAGVSTGAAASVRRDRAAEAAASSDPNSPIASANPATSANRSAGSFRRQRMTAALRPCAIRRAATLARRLTCAAMLAGALLRGSSAAAEEVSAAQMQLAKDLFDDARKRMASEDFAGAARELEESLLMFHGKGTLFNLAVCYEHLGRFGRAWALYNEVADAAAQAGEMDREHVGREHAAAIAGSVPHLIVQVHGAIDGLVVRRDGAGLGRSTWGARLPVDPGETALTAEAPGHKPWREVVVLAAGETKTIQVPALEADPASVPRTATPEIPRPLPPPARASLIGPQRAIALAIAGAGVVTLGVGSYLGIKALAEWPTAPCPNDRCPSQSTVDQRTASRADGDAATWTLLAGGVAVAGAAVLWFTGVPAGRAGIGIGPGSVSVIGGF